MCLSEKLVFEFLLRAIEDNVKLPQCTHTQIHTAHTCKPDYSRHGSMLMGNKDYLAWMVVRTTMKCGLLSAQVSA